MLPGKHQSIQQLWWLGNWSSGLWDPKKVGRSWARKMWRVKSWLSYKGRWVVCSSSYSNCIWLRALSTLILVQFMNSTNNWLTPQLFWNPNDPCFGLKRPCFWGLSYKNRAGIYIYICTYSAILPFINRFGRFLSAKNFPILPIASRKASCLPSPMDFAIDQSETVKMKSLVDAKTLGISSRRCSHRWSFPWHASFMAQNQYRGKNRFTVSLYRDFGYKWTMNKYSHTFIPPKKSKNINSKFFWTPQLSQFHEKSFQNLSLRRGDQLFFSDLGKPSLRGDPDELKVTRKLGSI